MAINLLSNTLVSLSWNNVWRLMKKHFGTIQIDFRNIFVWNGTFHSLNFALYTIYFQQTCRAIARITWQIGRIYKNPTQKWRTDLHASAIITRILAEARNSTTRILIAWLLTQISRLWTRRIAQKKRERWRALSAALSSINPLEMNAILR